MNLLRPVLLLLGTALCGQPDPFALPVEAQSWARRAVLQHQGTKQKLQGILDAVFSAPAPAGLGLGMVYDNSRTRSVEEVWTERRANCLSLTAFFVAACRAAGIEAKYAEPTNTNRWHRVGNLVRLERHVVALVPSPPLDDVVADFLPQLRRRVGVYVVTIHSEARFKALFHSNRAVEMLDAGRQEEALAQANLSVAADASCAVGWNVRGVVHQAMDRDTEAEACFRKAMALDPKDGTPVGNLEQFMRGRGRQDEAQALRTLGADLRKKDPFFHSFLCEEAMEAGDWDEAQRAIKVALKLQPFEPEFHLAQARIHLQRGKDEAAVKSLKEARRWSIPKERDRFDAKLAALVK